jgi:hypothetical protein
MMRKNKYIESGRRGEIEVFRVLCKVEEFLIDESHPKALRDYYIV